MAQATANITGQIAGLAMDKLDAAVADSEKGLAGGDMPKANNAWVKVMGFDDDVVYKDYLKSSKSANKQAWKYYFLIRVFRKKGN